MNEFSEHWIEVRTSIDGKVLVHLVLLEFYSDVDGRAVVDSIKHNIIVYRRFSPNYGALENPGLCCAVSTMGGQVFLLNT